MRRGGSLDATGALPAGAEVEAEVSPEAAVPAPPRRDARRSPWWPWLLLVVVLVGALAVGTTDAGGPTDEGERAAALARTIKCPQCAGQSVAESDVVASREIRRDISRRIEAGQSDEEIRDAYVTAYGRDILMSPPTSGLSALVWLLPVAALALAGIGLAVAFRRWRRDETAPATAADRALVAEALAAEPVEPPEPADPPTVAPGDDEDGTS